MALIQGGPLSRVRYCAKGARASLARHPFPPFNLRAQFSPSVAFFHDAQPSWPRQLYAWLHPDTRRSRVTVKAIGAGTDPGTEGIGSSKEKVRAW